MASVAMFAFLILTMSMVKDMLNLLAEGQLTLRAFARLTGLMFPYVFVYALPMGFITGAMLAMGRLSSDREILALRAAGVSVIRLSSSILMLAIVGTVVSLAVNFYYGPLAKTKYRQELKDTIQSNPLGFIVEKTFVKDFDDIVIYVGRKEDQVLHDLWIWRLNEASQVTLFARAERGRFNFVEGSAELQLDTEDTIVEYRSAEDPEDFKSQRFYPISMGEVPFKFPMSKIIGAETLARKLSWMTFDELQAEIARFEGIAAEGEREAALAARESALKARMVFHKNFAMGFAVLSFACIAVPLGLKTSRKESAANIGIGLGLGLLFYLCLISVDWLEGRPELRPHLLYWAPNLGLQAAGIWMFVRLDHGSKGRKLQR